MKVLQPGVLRSAFKPGTEDFDLLVSGCTRREYQRKFRHLETLSPRALRAETGSAARLFDGVFGSPAFAAWSRGGFDFGQFLQDKGMLIMERGELGDDAARAIMGATSLLVIAHAKRRRKPYPTIRVVIDEATNAGLVGQPELRGIAETNKNGLYWEFL